MNEAALVFGLIGATASLATVVKAVCQVQQQQSRNREQVLRQLEELANRLKDMEGYLVKTTSFRVR